MKLEVKHLAPYLPYGLKMNYGIHNPELIDVYGEHTIYLKYNDYRIKEQDIQSYKPILRSLKDLSGKMKNNVSYADYLWYDIIATDSDSFDKYEFYEKCKLGLINFLPIMVYEQLLKWHFDVFGLIEKGLAVDINTLSIE